MTTKMTAKNKKRRAAWRKKSRAKRTTLRDVVKAAHDNGMHVEVELKPLKDFVPGTAREVIQAAIDANAEIRNTVHVNSTVTPEQAAKIAEVLSSNQAYAYSLPCSFDALGEVNFGRSPFADAMAEGVRAHEEAEAALNRAHGAAFTDGVRPAYVDPRKDPSPEDLMLNVRYGTLRDVLNRAFDQAARGKGHERHGRGLSFEDQPTQIISDLLDSDAGLAFQAIKKVNEGMRLEHDAKIKEMLGAINYIASIVIHMERNKK
jgi:hypothetical protein